MSTSTISCPICGQEFPAYDQRGFRNAGFTAHHNRCLNRQHQQQSDSHQPSQQSSRASRFALAIRRQLLPAPLVTEGQHISPTPPALAPIPLTHFDGTTRSDLLPSPFDNLASQNPPPEKQHLQPQVRPMARQRHTWNHWNVRRASRRRGTSSGASSVSSASLSSVASTPLPASRHIRDRRSLPVIHTSAETFPLFNTMPNASLMLPNTSAMIALPPRLPTSYMSEEPLYSPTNSPPFTSMLTALPLDSIYSLPSSVGSNTSANQYDYIDVNQWTLTQQQSAIADWALSYHSPPGNDVLEHPQVQHQHLASTSDGYSQSFSHSSTEEDAALHTYLDDQLVLSCHHCQPQNGAHDPSCSLIHFYMSSLMNDTEDSFPPA